MGHLIETIKQPSTRIFPGRSRLLSRKSNYSQSASPPPLFKNPRTKQPNHLFGGDPTDV